MEREAHTEPPHIWCLPPTAQTPLPHPLFPVLSRQNSNFFPKKRKRWLLHILICRVLPLLRGIHLHYVWLDLHECTKLPPRAPIVRGQPPWELSSLQPQLEWWCSSIGRVIASPNENDFHLIKRWKKFNQYRIRILEGWSQKEWGCFVSQVKNPISGTKYWESGFGWSYCQKALGPHRLSYVALNSSGNCWARYIAAIKRKRSEWLEFLRLAI